MPQNKHFVNIFHILSQFNCVMYISKSSFPLTLTISKQSSLIFNWVKHYLSNWIKYLPHHYTITWSDDTSQAGYILPCPAKQTFWGLCQSDFLALYNIIHFQILRPIKVKPFQGVHHDNANDNLLHSPQLYLLCPICLSVDVSAVVLQPSHHTLLYCIKNNWQCIKYKNAYQLFKHPKSTTFLIKRRPHPQTKHNFK